MQFDADFELNGSPNSNPTIPLSPAPDCSDVILDPILVEREIARQSLHKESDANENEHATDGLREGTISYEVAMEREIEYQKRVKEAFLQPSATTRFPLRPSRELPPEQSLKRKMMSGIQREPMPHECHSPKQAPQDWQATPPNLYFQQPSLEPLEDCGPSTQQLQSPNPSQLLNCSQPRYRPSLQQQLQDRPPFCRSPQGQQILPRESKNQPTVPNQKRLYWCNFCQMNLENPSNLKQHYQSETHNAKRLLVSAKKTIPNGNKMLWCKECSVPCIDEASLAQHRAGKKHAARLRFLQSNYGASRAAVSGETSGTAHPYGFKNMEPQRKTWGAWNVGPK